MVPELTHKGLSKRDRILTAIAAYPKRYKLKNKIVSEVTDSSSAYVHMVRAKIESGEITQADLEEVFDEALAKEYREVIDKKLEKQELEPVVDEDKLEQETGRFFKDITDVEDETGESEGVDKDKEVQRVEKADRPEMIPRTEVIELREVVAQYRSDAEAEREHFTGAAHDVAVQKYLIADTILTQIDDMIE